MRVPSTHPPSASESAKRAQSSMSASTYDELEPFYTEVEKAIGVSGRAGANRRL